MKAQIKTLLVAPPHEEGSPLGMLLQSVRGVQVLDVSQSYDVPPEGLARLQPDLVVIDLDPDPTQALSLIQTISRCRTEVAILPVSRGPDAGLILSCVRAGAREFLALPATTEDIETAIERLLSRTEEDPGQATSQHLIAITGATGGVGCTTLAVNLAISLARLTKQETVLVDLDLSLGAVDVCLDLAPVQSLADMARNVDRLDPLLLKRSLTRHASGLYVLPAPTSLEDAASIDPDSLSKMIRILQSLFPFVVVDLSKSFHLTDLLVLEQADQVLVVVQLEPVCMRNTSRILEELQRHYPTLGDRIQIVANRVGASPFEIAVKQGQELLKRPIDWTLIEAGKLFASTRSRGVPLQDEASGSRLDRAICDLARSLAPAATAVERRPRGFGRFAAFFF